MHIVPDALGNGFPFQLRKHGNNKHHRPAHGRAGVELLPDGNEGYFQLGQFINQTGEVADIAADSVQSIHDDRLELMLPNTLHHISECRSVQVAAGKALVLKHHASLCIFFTKEIPHILPAQLHLISDTFAFAREFGFPGIDGDCFLVFPHFRFLPLAM